MSEETFTVGEAPKSPFIKAVKNIRSLINKGDIQVRLDRKSKKQRLREEALLRRNDRPQRQPTEKIPGSVVYLSHLPQGFEEKGIRGYLEQFGKVKGVKLVRSKKTGQSRGFAFVEFVERDIAKIVVETMNNYLMYKRLIKAELLVSNDSPYAPKLVDSAPVKPEKTQSAHCRQAHLMRRNKVLSKKAEQSMDAHTRRSLRRLQKKLDARGISFQMKATKKVWKPVMGNEASALSQSAAIENPSTTSPAKEYDDSLVLVRDESDSDFDFEVPSGMQVTQWRQPI